jgi:hypothetical protein
MKTRGFALVVTLSLMILLTIIAVGLLTLSSISLRASTASAAMAEARANARMAMQLAVAQLQSLAGQDTRVTASSNVLDSSEVTVTGVWRSWEGNDHDATGKPIVPDYSSKTQAGDPSKPPGSGAGGRFLGWLTSTTADLNPDSGTVPNVSSEAASGFVRMVSDGSVIDTAQQVYMRPTMVNNSKGVIAWWTSGDNAKAMINADSAEKPSGAVAWHQRVKSNGRADGKIFGLEKVDDYKPNQVVPTTGNLELAAPGTDLRKIHDLTAFSRGLLTNTATGGWRKDLSLMSEKFSSLPSSNLPFFTLAPGKDQAYSKAQLNSTSGNPIIYPWAKYRNNGTGDGWQQVPPICSWSALVDYTQQYTEISTTTAKTGMPAVFGKPYGTDQRLAFQDQVRRVPQIARIQWIYSIGSRSAGGTASAPKYNPGILVTPVLTLWNPYNVELTVNSFSVNIQETARSDSR